VWGAKGGAGNPRVSLSGRRAPLRKTHVCARGSCGIKRTKKNPAEAGF
jgi:hypothetical protein